LTIGVSIEGKIVYTDVDLAPLMKDAGKLMRESVLKNFVEGGRPSMWPVLSTGLPSHLAQSGELAGSVMDYSGENWAEVRSATPYSGIHQFGGTVHPTFTVKMRRFFWAMWYQTGNEMWKRTALKYAIGEKLNINIPPRPYMVFQEEDKKALHELFQGTIIKFINADRRPIHA
jgi:phage gpG-like protein